MPNKVFTFYRDGFRSMVVGRTLWKVILIKLFLIFAVLKVFFFSTNLHTAFHTDTERANYVLGNLTRLPAAR
ncbi:DUF4492 domain-containing protein [Geomesophilobacter sediminis]|uniref:DUF4492 domain-containing protein n=1 Tax=Geomesophilobacter sediminis TaxID=2798584 RepID=A0A8J7J507_9BACT|nr:DUF4492 domain-containing protein [Geomesophilobacter sediminis]MBJ6723371.1 DUF4492 domain-containing protein [Geomesophilobacter sediminis]